MADTYPGTNISKTPPTGTNAGGQNQSSGNAPDFVTKGWDKAKEYGQKVFDGISDGAENFMSDIRGQNLPTNLEAKPPAQPFWGETEVERKDWRVSLSLPPGDAFRTSTLLAPLKGTRSKMVFPYTPTIILSHTASYNQITPIHNNYPFFAYQNSQVDQLVITGQFYCQNDIEARYWIACLHYLRAVTKMNYGAGSFKDGLGSPPPIVKLNGYGEHVFKDVPVIITQFTVDMPNEVDYIGTGFENMEKEIDVSDFAPPSKLQRMDYTWAPSESQFSVTCQPVYSRDKVEKFSYNDFINGNNLKDGYI